RRHGEQFGADVDQAAQEALLAFELALPTGHPVERLASELAGGALDVPEVAGQRTEVAVRAGSLSLAGDQRRQPAGVEAARLRGGARLAAHGRVRVDDVAGHRQVRVD